MKNYNPSVQNKAIVLKVLREKVIQNQYLIDSVNTPDRKRIYAERLLKYSKSIKAIQELIDSID